jgi:hypothetical protein
MSLNDHSPSPSSARFPVAKKKKRASIDHNPAALPVSAATPIVHAHIMITIAVLTIATVVSGFMLFTSQASSPAATPPKAREERPAPQQGRNSHLFSGSRHFFQRRHKPVWNVVPILRDNEDAGMVRSDSEHTACIPVNVQVGAHWYLCRQPHRGLRCGF